MSKPINAASLPIASLAKRIFGGLIDLTIKIAIFIGLVRIMYMLSIGVTYQASYSADTGAFYSAHLSWFGSAIVFTLICLLFSFSEYLTGKTPGKYVVGTRVISEDYQKIHFGQALARNVLRIIDGFIFYLVGIIAIACNAKNQRLGDMAGRTIVVDEKASAEPKGHKP